MPGVALNTGAPAAPSREHSSLVHKSSFSIAEEVEITRVSCMSRSWNLMDESSEPDWYEAGTNVFANPNYEDKCQDEKGGD